MKQLNLIFPVLMLSCAVAAAIESEGKSAQNNIENIAPPFNFIILSSVYCALVVQLSLNSQLADPLCPMNSVVQ